MKSLLFSPDPALQIPPGCSPGREERETTYRKNGRLYKLVLREKICVDDPYLVMLKAAAFAIQQDEPYMGQEPPRDVRDFLIKSAVVI